MASIALVRPSARREADRARRRSAPSSLGVFAVVTVQALAGHRRDAPTSCWPAPRPPRTCCSADMMHDAVRGDVLQALVSGGDGRRSTTRPSPTWPSTRRRSSSTWPTVATDDLGAEVGGRGRRGHAGGRGLPGLGRARSSTSPAGTRRGRSAAYPQFRRAFAALEEALPAVGRRRRAHAAEGPPRRARPSASTAITLALVVAGRRRAPARPARLGRSPARSSARSARSAPSWRRWPTAT